MLESPRILPNLGYAVDGAGNEVSTVDADSRVQGFEVVDHQVELAERGGTAGRDIGGVVQAAGYLLL